MDLNYPEFAKIAIEEGKVFKKEKPVKWKCRNCGYIYEGTEAPEVSPVCSYPQSFYDKFKQFKKGIR